MALTASSIVPKAVNRITSTSGAMALAARSSSIPLRPGILRSLRTRSMPPDWSRSRAARPSDAATTRYPSRVSVRSRLSRRPGSSSATRMRAGSAMDGSLDGQPEREADSAARTVLPAQLAAVLLGDLPCDRQPEPRALGLGGEERLEEAAGHLVGDSGAGVAH